LHVRSYIYICIYISVCICVGSDCGWHMVTVSPRLFRLAWICEYIYGWLQIYIRSLSHPLSATSPKISLSQRLQVKTNFEKERGCHSKFSHANVTPSHTHTHTPTHVPTLSLIVCMSF